MPTSIVHFILYVADQNKSRNFYAAVFATEPILDVPGMTEFELNVQCKLGLMPETGIAKIICPQMPHPSSGNGIPRCEIYLFPENPEACIARALGAGATLIAPFQARDWGHSVAYLADLDGHVLAIAGGLSREDV